MCKIEVKYETRATVREIWWKVCPGWSNKEWGRFQDRENHFLISKRDGQYETLYLYINTEKNRLTIERGRTQTLLAVELIDDLKKFVGQLIRHNYLKEGACIYVTEEIVEV